MTMLGTEKKGSDLTVGVIAAGREDCDSEEKVVLAFCVNPAEDFLRNSDMALLLII
jgi:hypothetical protein